MDLKEAIKIIDFDTDNIPTEEECLEAYITFFGAFGVAVKNEDGSFKSLGEIFQEAHDNIMRNKSLIL